LTQLLPRNKLQLMRHADQRPSRLIYCLALAAITLAVYGQVAGFEFVTYQDDGVYVTNNVNVQKGLRADSILWAFTSFHGANWHPLTWLSHMLDIEIYGLRPSGHHVTSLLLHMANVLLLFLLLDRVTGRLGASAFVAALFAVHPLHVESVAWVAERKDVLSTFFWFVTIWAYLQYLKRSYATTYAVVAVSYALGLMAKPMLVSLPIVLLLLDYWPLDRFQKKRLSGLIREKLPLVIMAAGSCVVTFIAQKSGGAVSELARFGLVVRIENALVSYLGYLWNTLWPVGLHGFYVHPGLIPTWKALIAAFVLFGISALCVLNRPKRPYLLVGWLWYLITLIPVIGILQVGEQAMADRYTYIPLIGFFVAAIWLVCDLLGIHMADTNRKHTWPASSPLAVSAVVAACILVILLAVGAYNQAGFWRENETLFGRSLAIDPDNYLAHHELGVHRLMDGDLEDALKHLKACVAAEPEWGLGHANLATALLFSGDYAAAWKQVHMAEANNCVVNPKMRAQLASLMPEPKRVHSFSR